MLSPTAVIVISSVKQAIQRIVVPRAATNLTLRWVKGKIEKVPRGIRGEKSSKDMTSSRNLVSTIGALASPKMGDGTRCPEE